MDLKEPSHEVNPGDRCNDEGNNFPIEQESELLDKLDDDCLREIFKYLALLDLSNAAEVCIRFNQHANGAFNAKYKHVLNIDKKFELDGRPDETEAVLRNFGPSIHTLRITSSASLNSKAAASSAVRMINPHTTTALKELYLFGVDINNYVENLRPVLMKLEVFEFDGCMLKTGTESLFGQTFPSLKQAQFRYCNGPDLSDLEQFIEMNPNLKALMIGKEYWTDEFVNCIHLIGEKLSSLVELEIDTFDHPNEQQLQMCARSFCKLGSLKVLKFNCTENFVAEPLINEHAKNEIQIEHLQLISARFDDGSMKSLLQLKHIKILELDTVANLTERHIIELTKELSVLEKFVLKTSEIKEYLTIDGLVEMIKHAKKLSHFILCDSSNIKIDINDYQTMLKAVQKRSAQLHLSIGISNCEINVSGDILSENRNWLSIKVLRFFVFEIIGIKKNFDKIDP